MPDRWTVFTPRPLDSRPSTPASHFANISRLSLDSRLSCVNHAFSLSPDSRLLDNDDSEIVALPPSPDCVLSNASQHHGFSSKCLVCLHQRVSLFDRYNFLGAREFSGFARLQSKPLTSVLGGLFVIVL